MLREWYRRSISHRTAKTHLRAVYRKLEATNRTDAVERARLARLL